MIRKYVYKEKEYSTPWEVRQEIYKQEGLAFGPEPEKYDDKVPFWAELGVTYSVAPDPEPTEEEKKAQELEEAKRQRAEQVAAIKVEVDGMLFDGDETSQSRMARALEVASITGMKSTVWVLADNTVATVTVEQMQKALSQAMLQMGELWTVPYEDPEKEAETNEPALAKVGV